ncbi:MAG: shikimate dehydrogenase [Deltaproteobacteria bacterium]|nr:MAG: shikimate dehydrogenase [Deltaproteobacteria bacterium]
MMGGDLKITAATGLYGVIGSPVSHSLSPVMQTSALKALGIDACYLAFDVGGEALADALKGAYALGVRGLNITVPHKVSALALSTEADITASATGAANTLVRCAGGWRAHNTDVEGFSGAIVRELGFKPSSKGFVVGGGGAARAAVLGYASLGVEEIYITGRNPSRIEEVVSELSGAAGKSSLSFLPLAELPAKAKPGDLVASATPLGLSPDGRWPWELEKLDKGVLLYDMAYMPGGSSLEKEAKLAGLKVTSGLSMLLLQGAAALWLWTGLEPPVKVMEQALYEGAQ